MLPMAIVTLIAGGAVVGAFLKLFSDHRVFRRCDKYLHDVFQRRPEMLVDKRAAETITGRI